MPQIMRTAAAVAGLGAALAVPSAAQAAEIRVPECARVVAGEKTVPIAGTGFRPGGFIRVVDAANQSSSLGSATADASGAFSELFFGPTFPDGKNRMTVSVSAVDDQGTASPPVPLQVVNVTATLPERARPSSRVRYRVYGFQTGRRVYLHIRRGGRTRGSFRISTAKGACGIASRRMRYMPLRRWSTGTYDYYFQHTRRFDRSQPAVVQRIIITRRVT